MNPHLKVYNWGCWPKVYLQFELFVFEVRELVLRKNSGKVQRIHSRLR